MASDVIICCTKLHGQWTVDSGQWSLHVHSARSHHFISVTAFQSSNFFNSPFPFLTTVIPVYTDYQAETIMSFEYVAEDIHYFFLLANEPQP